MVGVNFLGSAAPSTLIRLRDCLQAVVVRCNHDHAAPTCQKRQRRKHGCQHSTPEVILKHDRQGPPRQHAQAPYHLLVQTNPACPTITRIALQSHALGRLCCLCFGSLTPLPGLWTPLLANAPNVRFRDDRGTPRTIFCRHRPRIPSLVGKVARVGVGRGKDRSDALLRVFGIPLASFTEVGGGCGRDGQGQ
jgi:hypothetical protein